MSFAAKPSLQLIVFDLDGTLVDSRRDLAESVNDLIAERGGRPLPEEAIGRMVGDGAAMLVRRAFEASRLTLDDGALARFLEMYEARPLKHTRPYRGVVEMLDHLSAHRDLAVLTNKPIGSTHAILDGLNLSRYFAASRVLGGDGPLPRKPDPAGLRFLASEAGLAPAATLLVGDSPVDIRTARAARSPVCLARWGFGAESISAGEMIEADYVADAPAQVSALMNL